MDSLRYHVIFDFANQTGLQWPGAITIVAFVLLVSCLGLALRSKGPRRHARVVFMAVPGLLVAKALLRSALTYSEYRAIAAQLANGSYTIVEGRVEDFVFGDSHVPETFTVAGHAYSLRPAVLSIAYHVELASGRLTRLVRPGQHVRLTDVDGKIVRIEVPAGPQ